MIFIEAKCPALSLPSLLIAVCLCRPFVVLSQLSLPVAAVASLTSLDPGKTLCRFKAYTDSPAQLCETVGKTI